MSAQKLFKVGDRVRLIPDHTYNAGRAFTGTVTDRQGSGALVTFELDHQYAREIQLWRWASYPDEIEHIFEAP
jgi:hypothetical protein